MRGVFVDSVRRVLKHVPVKRRLSLWMVVSAVTACALAAGLFSLSAIEVVEWRLADQWAAGGHGPDTTDKVAVIGIDEDLFEKQGFEWPLEKDVYGHLIAFLHEVGAKVVVFDIIFSDNLYACGKGDEALRLAMNSFSDMEIVMCFGAVADWDEQTAAVGASAGIPRRFSFGKGAAPLYSATTAILPYAEVLEGTEHLGCVNFATPFLDGVGRRHPLFIEVDSCLYPSLGLAAAAAHQDVRPRWAKEERRVLLGEHVVPLDDQGHLYVDFAPVIPFYPLSRIRDAHGELLSGEEPALGREQFEGRIVFVGNSAVSLSDLGVNPVSSEEVVEECGNHSPNVMMHARTALTILDDSAIRYHGRASAILVSVVLVLVLAVLFRFVSMQYSFPVALVLLGALFFLSRYFYTNSHFVPVVEAAAAGGMFVVFASLGIYLERDADHRYLRATFGKYISPLLIADMAENNIQPALGGEEVYGTAFFSDIESFSSFSETLSPMELIAHLNEYFSTMTRILLDHSGTLDKYIGDAIVAFFGAPRPSHHHAREACTAAVRMQEALAGLRAKWQKLPTMPEKVRTLKMRIGINTGRFVTGNMGCDLRMNYTMLGDTVNLAARLEGAGKEYGIYTVVGEETYEVVRHDFLFRKLDTIRVKGRAEPGGIYQLMGKPREGDEGLRELVETYENGLAAYVRGDFPEAKALFESALKLERFPDLKNPSRVMLDRTEHLIRIDPGKWDGVYTMEHK